jgi:hypothetical protein
MFSEKELKIGDKIRVWVKNRMDPYEGTFLLKTEDSLIWRAQSGLQGRHIDDIIQLEKIQEAGSIQNTE